MKRVQADACTGGVVYKVNTIYIRGINGEIIDTKKPIIAFPIGADKTLNDILINGKK